MNPHEYRRQNRQDKILSCLILSSIFKMMECKWGSLNLFPSLVELERKHPNVLLSTPLRETANRIVEQTCHISQSKYEIGFCSYHQWGDPDLNSLLSSCRSSTTNCSRWLRCDPSHLPWPPAVCTANKFKRIFKNSAMEHGSYVVVTPQIGWRNTT